MNSKQILALVAQGTSLISGKCYRSALEALCKSLELARQPALRAIAAYQLGALHWGEIGNGIEARRLFKVTVDEASHNELTSQGQPFQHVAPCIIMSQGNGLRPSKLPRQGCIPRHVLVPLPALGPMPVPTLVVPGSSTVLRNSSLSHVSR